MNEDLKIVREALDKAFAWISGGNGRFIIDARSAIDRIAAAQASRKVLTDEAIEIEAVKRYGIAYYGAPGDRVVVSEKPLLFVEGAKFARDNGYLAQPTINPAHSHLLDQRPDVEAVMDVVEPFIEEGISQMHDHSSDHGFQYDSDHPNWERTMNDLRQRMIDAKLCQP